MTSFEAPANPIDHVFRTQLKAFVAGLEQTPVPEMQDMRAGVLAFISAFAPEALSGTSIKLLTDTRDRIRTWPSYPTDFWWRIPYLDVAVFNLQRDMNAIRHLIENLAHGARGIRTHLFPPLGLALPLLDLDATAFVPQMGKNFEIGHLGNDQGICLLLASDTLAPRKREMLEHWRAIAANEADRETLGKASDGLYIANHAMLHEYLLIVLHLTEVAFAAQRETLPLFSVTPAQMLSRAKAHPLMQPSLCL